MKKIYLIVSGAFIILLIIISILLSFGKKSTTNTQKDSPFPTSILRQESVNQRSNQPSSNTVSETGNGNGQNLPGSSIDISAIEPVETLDFKLAYVTDLNKLVVEKKTPQAEELFYQWVDQNQLNQVINNRNKILFTDKKIIPTPSDSLHKLENKIKDFFQLMDDLNIINQKANENQPTPTTTTNNPTSYPNLTPFPTYSGNMSGKVYYSQCGGTYGNIPFAPGCDLCYAGCGPTTAAMIAASYLNPAYNPQTMIDLYKANGYDLSCDGTNYTDAYQLFQKLGFQTTTIYQYNFVTADKVVPDLRNYLAAGWTFFTLVKGHFFWLTDIDSLGNIFAYDPVYSSQVPYNENSHNPVRLYFRIFGVKK